MMISLLSTLWMGMQVYGSVPVERVTHDTLTVSVLNYDELKPLLHFDNDTTYVVSFWATWCVPCVKELPYFIQLAESHREKPLRLLLVSLDFRKDYVGKLQPFVEKHGIGAYVVVLDDNRANYWIDDIHGDWTGSIPATLVYKGKKRAFFERTFHHVDELHTIVKPFLNL